MRRKNIISQIILTDEHQNAWIAKNRQWVMSYRKSDSEVPYVGPEVAYSNYDGELELTFDSLAAPSYIVPKDGWSFKKPVLVSDS